MKTKTLLRYLPLLALLFVNALNAQENTPVVTIEQGEIIGALPYGQHFFITGSTALPSGEQADSVVVEIYDAGVNHLRRNKKNTKELSDKQKDFVISGENKTNLVETSTWVRYLDKDVTNFRVYVNKPLRFAREYILQVNYYRRYNFSFSERQKNEILENVVENLQEEFENKGELDPKAATDYLNVAVMSAMRDQVIASGDNFYGFGNSLEEEPLVNPASLIDLTENYLNVLPAEKENLKNAQKNLSKAKTELKQEADPEEKEAIQEDIDKWSERVRSIDKRVKKLEAGKEKRLSIIRNRLALVSVDRPAQSSRPTAITELDAIKVGTSFGGGGIIFNPRRKDIREINALAYTALKFYIFPVDKRIDKPYLTSFPFFNRASVLFGIVTSNSFEYRGQELEKPIGVAPLVGISYDVNRYFGVDFGATVFRQPSTSYLLSAKKTRISPVIGINFDFDGFNRIKSLTKGNVPYNISTSVN